MTKLSLSKYADQFGRPLYRCISTNAFAKLEYIIKLCENACLWPQFSQICPHYLTLTWLLNISKISFRFYIGCEKCSDWFHGRCVGILQSEADKIDEYICPRCAPDSKLNKPNHKRLNADDYEAIRKLVKSLWVSVIFNIIQIATNNNL